MYLSMRWARVEGCGEVRVSLSWGVHMPPNKHVLEYLLVYFTCTCTHHARHRCPTCFGNLLLSCFDVFGGQIGSTESGGPVWTYENRCRRIWAPSYGSFIRRQRAWRTCTAVHVQESATLGNCNRVAPHVPTPVLIMSIHVSHMKLP